MKSFASKILIITICTLIFSSCSKKKDVSPLAPTNYGTVIFWTKNAANFALCNNNITITLWIAGLYGGGATNSANIRYILPSAPTYCGNEAAIGNIFPGTKYYYGTLNCAIGQLGPIDSFSLSPYECVKIEIP